MNKTEEKTLLTGGGGDFNRLKIREFACVRKVAFTMAEILLSLTIIGVVAAITLPSLTGNINERTWNTQRKALFARMSQAMALMPALNGYGTTEDNAAEAFITSGLSKVFKLNNICGKDDLESCGFPAKLNTATTTNFPIPRTSQSLYSLNVNVNGVAYPAYVAAAFETANGESILTFYNRNCKPFDVLVQASAGMYRQVPNNMCANFVFDLNGKKGPNTFGKDIGIITVFYPSDPVVVAPYTHSQGGEFSVTWEEGASTCRNFDNEYRMPNLEEMMSLNFNYNLVELTNNRYWTSKRLDSTHAWVVSLTGNYFSDNSTSSSLGGVPFSIKCVRR